MLNTGKTGVRQEDKRCSECGASGFVYSNGYETSADGVRGYRCLSCDTIKPEIIAGHMVDIDGKVLRPCTVACRMDPSIRCARPVGHKNYHESAPMPLGPQGNGGRWQFSDKQK